MAYNNVLPKVEVQMINQKEESITNYIYSLSKELSIEDTCGVLGNELELIALIKNCPFLYDKGLPEFKDVRKKNAAWNAIASVMQSTVPDVQQRWRSLRDTYNKYRKEYDPSKQSYPGKSWNFYDEMKFIDPHIIKRRNFKPNAIKSGFICESSEESKDDSTQSLNHDHGVMSLHSDVLQLISLIQERPILYNSKYRDFRNKPKKEETWNEIAEKLGYTAQDCECKWRTLRERYARERKALKVEGGDKSSWELYEALKFLDAHIRPRRQSMFRSVFNSSTVKDDDITEEKILLQVEDDDNNEELLETVEFIDTNQTSSKLLPNEEEPRISARVVADEDELFGQTIAAELRRIPSSKKKMKIKADMYRLLYENESDE